MAKDSNKAAAPSIIDVLAGADLAEIDKGIDERRAQIKKLEGEIGSLKLVRRSVDRFKNGPAKRDPNKPRKQKANSPAPPPTPSSDSSDALLIAVERAVLKLGAALIPAIARESGYTQALVAATLQRYPDRFVNTAGGVWKVKG